MEIAQVALTISIVILPLLLYVFIFRKSSNKAPLPPGPRGLPIVGYLPYLGSNVQHVFTELASRYGPIFKVQLGMRMNVVVSSPSIVKELSRDKDVLFANHDTTVALDLFSRGGLDINFAPYGSYWRNMRRIFVQEMLSKSSIDASYDIQKVALSKAIKLLNSNVGIPVDVGDLIHRTTVDVLMTMVLGNTIEADEQSKAGKKFIVLYTKLIGLVMRKNLSDIFPFIARFDFQGVAKEAKAVLKSLDEIFDGIINKSMETAAKEEAGHGNHDKSKAAASTHRYFIEYLLQFREREETDEGISTSQIKATTLALIVGGADTSVNAAKTVMTVIVHNKEVMQKVQKELEDVVGLNNTVEDFHLSKLEYLDAVIKETIRLYPTSPMLVPRKTTQTCTLAGYTIPKDTRIVINARAIQRDPEFWENPLEFQPERFLKEPGKGDLWGNNFHYIPFGSGRRVCPGIPLAHRMIMYTVALLVHLFDWQATETKEVDLSETGLSKGKPFFAIPTKRLPNSALYA